MDGFHFNLIHYNSWNFVVRDSLLHMLEIKTCCSIELKSFQTCYFSFYVLFRKNYPHHFEYFELLKSGLVRSVVTNEFKLLQQ